MKPKFTIAVLCVLSICVSTRAQDDVWTLQRNEVVAVLGGTNAVNMQNAGYFETYLTVTNADAKPRFIDLAWEGDIVYRQGTVIERWREEKFGDLANQLKDNKVTLVVLQFGQNEALDGLQKLDEFSQAYGKLLSVCKQEDRRVVMIAPVPFEKVDDLQPDLSQRNKELAKYIAAMKDLADKHECMFVDLFSMFSIRKAKLTNNGLHITPAAHETVAAAICSTVPTAGRIGTTDPLRAAISHKHQLWMNYWRPANWKCLYGDDGQREFGKSTAGGPTLRQEWAKLPSMIAKAEQEIWALANDVKEQE